MRARRYAASALPVIVTNTLAIPDYPSLIPDLLMWVDGRAPAYSDAAGTVLATPFAGRVRRVNYGAPAVGNAQALSDSVRPWRENTALNLKLGDAPSLSAPVAADCFQDAVTLVVSFNPLDAPAGGPQYLICNGGFRLKVFTFQANNVPSINYNDTAGFWQPVPGAVVKPGSSLIAIFRLTPSSIKATILLNGVRTDVTTNVTVNHLNLSQSSWTIGSDGSAANTDSFSHGSVAQEMVIARSISDAEIDALVAWLVANQAPRYCPVQVPFIGVNGDSIAACSAGVFGVPLTQRWSSVMQKTLGGTQPVNVVNAAISGDNIRNQRDVVFPDVLAPFYSATRTKNALILAAGTNDIATSGRTGSVVLADQYQAAATAAALGFKPFLCTILPRNPGSGFDVTNFNTQSGYVNTHTRAEAPGMGYGVIDFAAIPQAADPTNTTYFSDGIHPTVALQALMAATAATAVQTWLAA